MVAYGTDGKMLIPTSYNGQPINVDAAGNLLPPNSGTQAPTTTLTPTTALTPLTPYSTITLSSGANIVLSSQTEKSETTMTMIRNPLTGQETNTLVTTTLSTTPVTTTTTPTVINPIKKPPPQTLLVAPTDDTVSSNSMYILVGMGGLLWLLINMKR